MKNFFPHFVLAIIIAVFIAAIIFVSHLDRTGMSDIKIGKWYWTEFKDDYYQCKVLKGPQNGKFLVLVDYYTGDKYTLKRSSELYFQLGSKEQLENQ